MDLYWYGRTPMASQWPFPDSYMAAPDIPSDIDFYRDRNVARPTFQGRSPPPRHRSRERRFRSRSPPRNENEYYRSQNSRNYYKDSDVHFPKRSRQRLRNDDQWSRKMNQDRTLHDNERSSKRSPNQSYRSQRHRTETYKGDLDDTKRGEERSSSDRSHKSSEKRSCKNGDIIKPGDNVITGECISEKHPLLTDDVSSDDLRDDILNAETEERVIFQQPDSDGGLLISVQIAQREPKHTENKENIYAAHKESGNEKISEPSQSCVPSNEQRQTGKISPAKGDINIEMKALDEKIKAQKAKLKKHLSPESLKNIGLVFPEKTNENPKHDDDSSENKESDNDQTLKTCVNDDTVEKFENASVQIETIPEPEKLITTILENTEKLNYGECLGHSAISILSTNVSNQGNDTDIVNTTKSKTNRSNNHDTSMGKLNQTFQELEKDKSIASWARLLKKAVSSIGQNVVSSKTVVSLSNSNANDKQVESSSSHANNTEIDRSVLVASTEEGKFSSENSPNSSESELNNKAKTQCVMSSSEVNILSDKHEQTNDVNLSKVNEETKSDNHSTLKDKNEPELIDQPYSNLEQKTNLPTENNQLKPSAYPYVQKSHKNDAKTASGNKLGGKDPQSKQPGRAEKVKQINVQHLRNVKTDCLSKDTQKTDPVKNIVGSKSSSSVNKSESTFKEKVNCGPFVKKPEVIAKTISSKIVKDDTEQLPQVAHSCRHSGTNDKKKNSSMSADKDTSVKNERLSTDSQKTLSLTKSEVSKTAFSVKKSDSLMKDKAKVNGEQLVKKPEVEAKTISSKIVKDNAGPLPQVAHNRRHSGTNSGAKSNLMSADEDKDRKRRLSAPCEVSRKRDSLKKTEKTQDGKYFKLGEKESVKEVEKRKEVFKKIKHSEKEKAPVNKSFKHEEEPNAKSLKQKTIVNKSKSVHEDVANEIGKEHDKPRVHSELRKHDKSENCPITSENIQEGCNGKRDTEDDIDMDDFEIIDLRPSKVAVTSENAVKPDILDMKNLKEHVEVKYCDDRVVIKGQSQKKKFIERLKPLTFSDVSDDEKSSQRATQTPQKPLKRKRKQKVHKPMMFNSEDSSDNDLPESPFKISKKDSDKSTDNKLEKSMDILPGMNEFMKIDKAVYERGFDVRHDKILENDDIITTFGLLKPEYLYVKTDMTGHALLGKCVRCKCCKQFFNPLDFSEHHDEASVRALIAIDKCSMMDYTLCSTDASENIREVFKHFQDYFHQLRSKRRLSQLDIISSVTSFSPPPVREYVQVLDGSLLNSHTVVRSDSAPNQSTPGHASVVDTAPSVMDTEPRNCSISFTETLKNQNVVSRRPSIEANSGLTSPPIFNASTPLFNQLTLPLMAIGFESTPSTPSSITDSIHEKNIEDAFPMDESVVLEKQDSPGSVEIESERNRDVDPAIDTTDVNKATSSETTDVNDIEKKRSEAIDHLCRLYGINTPNRYTNVALLVTALHIDNTKRYIEEQNIARGNLI
ncbi:uncharacterized protein LOC127868046 isoform X2 [Dreissena polymorpha]|uniref:uncharacterized protein LOC127868046 isoform X2 n=1 Tax=Dreissena polymorpha TaxID=45954 RepID=UPI002264C9F7|nr:uncharacterized protein LOC127868046 isoform X2 [Dreissena polymorpha]